MQNAANQAGSGRIWIEKVRCLTQLPHLGGDPPNLDGPLGEVDRLIAELLADPTALAGFAAKELGDLAKKLPAELRGDDGPDLASPVFLGALLGQVRPLLDAQFRAARGGS